MMKYFLLLIAGFVITTTFAQKKSSKPPGKKFITSLKNYQGNDTLFKTKQGNLFKLSFVQDDEAEMTAETIPSAIDCNSASFTGTDRKKCKTSIAPATLKIKSLAAF